MNNKNYNNNPEGLRHIRTLIDEQKTVMMASELDTVPFSICPMTLQQMDQQGDLWFFVAKDSGLFQDIEKDNRVQIIYNDEQKHTYISIYGNATHIIANQKKDELWNSNLLTWFEGKDDPNLALISVNMGSAFYWDNENAKLVSLFKIGKGGSVKEESGSGVKGYVNL
ncbi:pyridoxamine 5'-phosphate oxidase family protein [Flagellimonas oceanensis]|uniref:pyridoxamine 5'-phosphate oxidase family protein n=1 Tax=Flagellimonas oceanensis TaxID=2499163 RepID=UPI000F8D1522|nr:pyridoxamine 5'-phosphate oxidase family protein [Allomuricauda oceanensis]